jgi:serine/threonine protein kinase
VRIGEKFFQATPAYCSPEQLEYAILGLGAKVEFDIFSLGMTTYYMLTGRESPVSRYLDEAIDLYNGNDVGSALKRIDEAKIVLKSWNIDLPSNVPSNLRNFVETSIKYNVKSLFNLIKNL